MSPQSSGLQNSPHYKCPSHRAASLWVTFYLVTSFFSLKWALTFSSPCPPLPRFTIEKMVVTPRMMGPQWQCHITIPVFWPQLLPANQSTAISMSRSSVLRFLTYSDWVHFAFFHSFHRSCKFFYLGKFSPWRLCQQILFYNACTCLGLPIFSPSPAICKCNVGVQSHSSDCRYRQKSVKQ